MFELSFQKRVSASWFFYGGFDYQEISGDSLGEDSRVSAFSYVDELQIPYKLFDYDAFSAFVELEYTLANGLLMSGSYRRTNGSAVSSTTQPNHDLYHASDAFYADPAFTKNWFAYRPEADTDEWSLGLSVPVGIDTSVDLAYSWYDIRGAGHRNYRNSVIALSLIHNF